MLMAYDIKPGDAVFVPSFTFFATAEMVSTLGAIPIFVDVNSRTFNIDPKKLEMAIKEVINEGKLKPRAIMTVDLFGLSADYDAVNEIAKDYNLLLFEDGAQGFGGSLNGKMNCSFGDAAITSFFPSKPLGCYGDGGAIFTNDDNIASLIRSLAVHGKGKSKYDNIRIGMNSRLDTIQAAILLPKLDIFKSYELDARNKVAKTYDEQLKDIVEIPYVPNEYISSWAQYSILLNSEEERNYLQAELKNRDIPTMLYYPIPLHLQQIYKDDKIYGDLSVSTDICKRILSLPMYPYLEENEIIYICNSIKEILGAIRNGK
jgi:dTDP-4-amino-4,6-dideoxygalactose transaminase